MIACYTLQQAEKRHSMKPQNKLEELDSTDNLCFLGKQIHYMETIFNEICFKICIINLTQICKNLNIL